jgi:hypothetical protein
MVFPSMFKKLETMPRIATMWNAAVAAIADAEVIAVFGFSFPESDRLLALKIREALNEKRKLRRLVVYDIDPWAVINRFILLVPKDLDIEIEVRKIVPGTLPKGAIYKRCPCPPDDYWVRPTVVHAGCGCWSVQM